MLSRLLIFIKVINMRMYLLLFISTLILLDIVMINTGLIDSLYLLSEYMVYPKRFITPYYIAISSYSLAPFTSIFNIHSIEDKLADLRDIERIVYEVLTLVEYDSHVYILRGVNNSDLAVIAGSYSIDGEELNDDCLNCLWIGSRLAEELGIDPRDMVVLYSPITTSSYVFTVKGIIWSNSPLDYEFISNTMVAQSVRGVGVNHVSFAIIFASDREALQSIARSFGVPVERMGLLERALLALRYTGRKVDISTYESISSFYLSRLGISRDLLYAVQLAIVILLTLSFYHFGKAILLNDIEMLRILHEQGLSILTIKFYTSALSILTMVASSIISLFTLSIISHYIKIDVLGYELTPIFNSVFLIYSTLSTLMLTLIGIWTTGVKLEEEY